MQSVPKSVCTIACSAIPIPTKPGRTDYLNPDSLRTLTQCYLEASLADAKPGEQFQFEREGYFCLDSEHLGDGKAVFNRTITLRDTWAKIEQKGAN